MSAMLEKRLEGFINSLDKGIKRIRAEQETSKIRNLIKESDANLLEDIKNDLIEIMRGDSRNE